VQSPKKNFFENAVNMKSKFLMNIRVISYIHKDDSDEMNENGWGNCRYNFIIFGLIFFGVNNVDQ